MSPMSIADTVLRPGAVLIDGRHGKPEPFPAFLPVVRKDLLGTHFIRCDEIANGVWRDHLPDFNPPGHRPTWHENAPYRPPFDSMWIEWTVAPELRNLAGVPIADIAVGLHVIPIEDWHPRPKSLPDDTGFGIIVERFFKSTTGYGRVIWAGTDNIFVGHDGHFIASLYIPETLHRGLTAEQHETSLSQFCQPMLAAVAMMNCKNVSLSDEEPARRPRKAKPEKIPRVRFQTIHLPRTSRGGGSPDSARLSSQEMARHYVRGHFKTYTADAPLLGRAVGTYWWGWQSRGSKQNGLIVSDYEVKAS